METRQRTAPDLAAIEVDEIGRSSFLVKGALAVGAAYGVAAVGPAVRRAFAQGGGGDAEILNFALTLEYLEAAYYAQGIEQVDLSGEVGDIAAEIRDNEQEHVDTLAAAVEEVGGTPAEEPQVDFGNAFSSESAFLRLAQTFEDTGVSAYNGAGPALESKELLGKAGSIVQVEARHAAQIRLLNGAEPAPVGFDKTLNMDQVLQKVEPFVRS